MRLRQFNCLGDMMASIFGGGDDGRPTISEDQIGLSVAYGMSVSEAAEKGKISESKVVKLYQDYLEKRNIGVLNQALDPDKINPENAQRALSIVDSIYTLIEATIKAEHEHLTGQDDGLLGASSLDPRSAAAAKSWVSVSSRILQDHPGLLAVATSEDVDGTVDGTDIDDRLKAAFETA